MENLVSSFLEFVRKAPTAFHATAEACKLLRAAGYTHLNEYEPWQLERGGRYFVTRNGSALMAFTLPKEGTNLHFQVVASHADSPSFKLKPKAEEVAAGHYLRLNVERYGGMIMSAWFDRPLSIAGRLMVRTERGVETRLYDAGRDLVMLPNMPIHFNREVNDGYKYHAQTDMLPLLAQGTEVGELDHMLSECGEVVASDLYLYSRMAGSVWGAHEEFFSSTRIDDLECAYLSLLAMAESEISGHVNLCAVLDNEEVGSGTKQGADSSFLQDVMERICASLGEREKHAALARSFMVSADNAHAVHPNHPEMYDADNRVYMNEGIVIKHNANQKYTTDAVSDAIFSEICRNAGCRVQHFTNRSDLVGGSTLGNIANSHVSMNTVDIGLAQLAMHSPYETAGTMDLDVLKKALSAFYGTEILFTADGTAELRG